MMRYLCRAGTEETSDLQLHVQVGEAHHLRTVLTTNGLNFSLGGAGMIILDQTHNPNTPKLNRVMLQFVGFAAMVISFGCCWVFMRMKLPGYMLS